ncbi:MAG: hypothetical protein EPN82_11960 [Bacteroidetes bacterium]|nr:MAG: hypothetical protein EPN82_11960 [Bacteroidota bacterium]
MFATYTLTKDELNYEFLDNLKKMLDEGEIRLTIEHLDETEYLMKSGKNHEHLMRGINDARNHSNLIEVPYEDILKTANEKD